MSDKPSEGVEQHNAKEDHGSANLRFVTQGLESSSNQNHATEETEPSAEEINRALKLLGLCAWRRFIKHIWPVMKSSSFWTALATVAIAAFTLALIIYSSRQWSVMERQLDAAERPWISFDTSITAPLKIDATGLSTTARFTLKNTGHTPAVVEMRTKLYPYTLNAQDSDSERRKLCMEPTPTIPEFLHQTIFPTGESIPTPLPDYVISTPSDEVRRARLIAPLLIACVVYHATFNAVPRHTIRIFRIRSTDLSSVNPQNTGTVVVPVERLDLGFVFIDATYAD